MLTSPNNALDTVVQSMADTTEMKKGTARKGPMTKKLKANSPLEEAQEKRMGIKDTPAQEAAETQSDKMNKLLMSRSK